MYIFALFHTKHTHTHILIYLHTYTALIYNVKHAIKSRAFHQPCEKKASTIPHDVMLPVHHHSAWLAADSKINEKKKKNFFHIYIFNVYPRYRENPYSPIQHIRKNKKKGFVFTRLRYI